MTRKVLAALLVFAVLFGVRERADAGETRVAMLLKTLSNPFWVDMKDGIEARARELGVRADVYAAESEADTEGQSKKLDEIIASGNYRGIGVAPITADNLIPGIVEANRKTVPVINIDSRVDDDALRRAGGHLVGFAGSDNRRIGATAGAYIADRFPEGCATAVIEGPDGDRSGSDRRKGFVEALKRAGEKYEIVQISPGDWDRDKSRALAAAILDRFPDVKAFYACNDAMALGVLQTLFDRRLAGKVVLVGTDASAETNIAIRAGEMVAVRQDPKAIGATALDILIDAAKSGFTGGPNVWFNDTLVDAKLVTKGDM